ncbi:DUF1840 domain-containing protein [Rhodoferax sp. OV413]|uniref:DUF1840 domain-containing protein n=1 Tax=Rhodoferax sp. OV413 TaxID=1855285 RepID=UPI0025DCA8FC|nr:DUF1840 domain-containing protein [Rhodoferax sp. OV413]
MLYKFKSKVASDVIMLEPNGRQILQLWGRTDAASQQKGILLAADLPAAISALEEAVAQEESRRVQAALAEPWAQEKGEDSAPSGVSLRQRAAPLLDMARRSLAAGKDITWGA